VRPCPLLRDETHGFISYPRCRALPCLQHEEQRAFVENRWLQSNSTSLLGSLALIRDLLTPAVDDLSQLRDTLEELIEGLETAIQGMDTEY
jgi:hypothetical protein